MLADGRKHDGEPVTGLDARSAGAHSPEDWPRPASPLVILQLDVIQVLSLVIPTRSNHSPIPRSSASGSLRENFRKHAHSRGSIRRSGYGLSVRYMNCYGDLSALIGCGEEVRAAPRQVP